MGRVLTATLGSTPYLWSTWEYNKNMYLWPRHPSHTWVYLSDNKNRLIAYGYLEARGWDSIHVRVTV